MLLKAKIYLKPGEKPPKGLEIKRGPKGGLYYETEVKIKKPKVPDLKTLHIDEIIRRLPTLPQKELHSLIDDERYYVRVRLAEIINQDGLFKLLSDPDTLVREIVAKRINEKNLHILLNDEKANVRVEVAKRINQKGLHQMINDEDTTVRIRVAECIDTKGLKEMVLDVGRASDIADKRLAKIAKIDGMIKKYNETKEIELTSDMKKEVSKIIEDDSGSIEMIHLIDEFYKHTPFTKFHLQSKDDWEGSSSSPLAGLLKDSILRQFGGKIRHHDAITDWKKFTERLYAQYPKEMIDKYVQTHKKLTRKILDVMFPDQDEIMVFRGTTKNEAISEVKKNETVSLQGNPLSSWTQRFQIAEKFADKENGIIVRTLVRKDDIWSTFMSHAYQGLEREFLIMSPKDRRGTVMKC